MSLAEFVLRTAFVELPGGNARIERCASRLAAQGRIFQNRDRGIVRFNGLDFDVQCGILATTVARERVDDFRPLGLPEPNSQDVTGTVETQWQTSSGTDV